MGKNVFFFFENVDGQQLYFIVSVKLDFYCQKREIISRLLFLIRMNEEKSNRNKSETLKVRLH
jgi:hypothetical protein